MEQTCLVPSPVGTLELASENGALIRISFMGNAPLSDPSDPLLKEAASQLNEYFNGNRMSFDLPLAPRGTDFRRAVWQALADVPYGETRSYGDIAKAAGNPKAARAVGSANRSNPLPIVIPCHRIIGGDGSLTGYAGGLEIKRFLLDLESRAVERNPASRG